MAGRFGTFFGLAAFLGGRFGHWGSSGEMAMVGLSNRMHVAFNDAAGWRLRWVGKLAQLHFI